MSFQFEEFQLEQMYSSIQVMHLIEQLLPQLPEFIVNAIQISRFIRSILLDHQMSHLDIPITRLKESLQDCGVPKVISAQLEVLFEEQLQHIDFINMSILEDLEIKLVRAEIIRSLQLEKVQY